MSNYLWELGSAKWVNDMLHYPKLTSTIKNLYTQPFINNAVTREDMKKLNVDRDVEAALHKKLVDKRVEAKLKLVEALGDDTYENGSVVRFDKKLTKDGILYNYAAIKAGNGRWYLTGAATALGGFTWEEFVLWLVRGDFPVTEINLLS